jgi:hypothetical protein
MSDEEKLLALEKAYDEARDRVNDASPTGTLLDPGIVCTYDICRLTLEELRAVVAYELLKDGMETKDAIDIWRGLNDLYNDRESIIQTLTDVFGY